MNYFVKPLPSIAIIALALTAMVMSSAATAGDWSKIKIATEGAYAPWNSTDASGKLIGFELDLVKDLCKRMKASCEVVAQAWDGIIPALQAGKYDAIMAGMSITDKRKQVISFSRCYAVTPASLVVLRSSPSAGFDTKIKSMNLNEVSAEEKASIDEIVQAFKGKTIGVQTSTTHENFLREYLGKDAEIRTYDTQENLDLDLQSGRVDAALASLSYWVPLLKSDKGSDMKLVGPSMSGGPFGEGVGVGIRQKDKKLATLFNNAINEALADGSIKKLAVQWFGFDASCQ